MRGKAIWLGGAALALLAVGGVWMTLSLTSALAQLGDRFGWQTKTAPAGPVVLTQIQALRRLETCRYNGSVLVRGDTGGPLPRWLAGDRLILMAHGEAVAGVDLGRMGPQDLRVEGTRAVIRLPRAEVLHVRVDNRASEVWERQAGVFTGPDPALEGKVRVEAEERLKEAALSTGLLERAREGAEETLRTQLGSLGIREVEFVRG